MTPQAPQVDQGERAPIQPLTKEQLMAMLDQPLKTLVEQVIDNDDYATERRISLNRAKRNWRFVKGDHFLAPGWVDNGDNEEIADWVSVEGAAEENGAQQKFCYPVNVVGADCWKYVAVTGQSAPNVKCEADDVSDQAAIEATKKAEISVIDLRSKWNADEIQGQLSFHQYTTGPTFGHVRYNTDKRKYGVTKVPDFDLVQVIGADGQMLTLPVPKAPKEYENGDVELSVYNITHVSAPFGIKALADGGWLRCQQNLSKFKLLKQYRKQLNEKRHEEGRNITNNATTNTSLDAQESTASASGTAKASRKTDWLFDQVWLDPENFEGLDEEYRQTAYDSFPEGIQIVRVNEKLVDVANESKNDCWSVCKVGRGEYIMENPIIHDAIPFQKAINDMWGLAVETILRAIPKTIVDQAVLSRKAAGEQNPTPAEIIFTIGNMGTDLSKSVIALPMARFSDQLVPFLELSRATMQDVHGILPQLTGGGEPASTYRAEKQRKDQAMLTLAPCTKAHGDFWQSAYAQGTKLRAKHGTGQIKVSKPGAFGISTDSVEMEDLPEGMWHCEADDGVPLSFTERADRLLGLLKEFPPEVVQQLALTDLVNITELLHLLQLAGFKSPIQEAYQKAVKIIGKLAQEEPVQDIDPMTGAPTMLPSIPIDDIEEDPSFFLQVAQRWFNSEDGEKVKAENPPGFENVKARARSARQMVQAAAMPPPEQAPGKESKPKAPDEHAQEPLPVAPIDPASIAQPPQQASIQ